MPLADVPCAHTAHCTTPTEEFRLNGIFVNTLHISKKSSLRAGGTRRPLQAEITYLNKLGLVNSIGGGIEYRIGVGLCIDWPKVQNSIIYFNNL